MASPDKHELKRIIAYTSSEVAIKQDQLSGRHLGAPKARSDSNAPDSRTSRHVDEYIKVSW
jgi:hypothetical protein